MRAAGSITRRDPGHFGRSFAWGCGPTLPCDTKVSVDISVQPAYRLLDPRRFVASGGVGGPSLLQRHDESGATLASRVASGCPTADVERLSSNGNVVEVNCGRIRSKVLTMDLSGYSLEALREDAEFVLYRGQAVATRALEPRTVLVSMPISAHPAPDLVRMLEHEWAFR